MISIAEELMRPAPEPTSPRKRVDLGVLPFPESDPDEHPRKDRGLELIADGWKIRDICARLKVTPATVIKWKRGEA